MDYQNLYTGKVSVYKRLIRNKITLISLIVIGSAVITGILGYAITPDSTPHANEQFIELSTKNPGFKVTMLLVRKNENIPRQHLVRRILFGEKSMFTSIPISSFYFDNEQIIVTEYSDFPGEDEFFRSFNMVDVVYPVSLDHPDIQKIDDKLYFTDLNSERKQIPVSELKRIIKQDHIVDRRFILGTDRFGRDLLSRLMLGTRVSLSVGFISVLISLVIGITLGAIAAYFGGFLDNLIMWFINVVWSIPTLLMVIAITLVLGKGFWQVFIAVGFTMWVEVARIVRGQVISVKEKEYIEAARALGYNSLRILVKHILPNVINPVIIISAANFASAILIEAGLSFLGIGVRPPVPSWGTMIKDHYGYMIVDKAYLAFFPGLAVMIMVLSFTMLGNGLRDALDVRQDKQ